MSGKVDYYFIGDSAQVNIQSGRRVLRIRSAMRSRAPTSRPRRSVCALQATSQRSFASQSTPGHLLVQAIHVHTSVLRAPARPHPVLAAATRRVNRVASPSDARLARLFGAGPLRPRRRSTVALAAGALAAVRSLSRRRRRSRRRKTSMGALGAPRVSMAARASMAYLGRVGLQRGRLCGGLIAAAAVHMLFRDVFSRLVLCICVCGAHVFLTLPTRVIAWL